jgi:hypothetical protein
LSREAQAFEEQRIRNFLPEIRNAAPVLMAMFLLAGCAKGFSLGKADVDRSLYTNTVSGNATAAADPARLSDEATIRNAVSSADLIDTNGQTLAWANSETGSRGSISNIIEYKDSGSLCRRFQASRESFDGVTMFNGDTCLGAAGDWRLRAFDAM